MKVWELVTGDHLATFDAREQSFHLVKIAVVDNSTIAGDVSGQVHFFSIGGGF